MAKALALHCGSLVYKAKIYLQTLDSDATFRKAVLLPRTEAVFYMYSMKPEKEYTAVNLIYFTPFEQKLLNGVWWISSQTLHQSEVSQLSNGSSKAEVQ